MPSRRDSAAAGFLKSLLSRKFVLALLGAGSLFALEQFPETVAVIVGYFASNAAEHIASGE